MGLLFSFYCGATAARVEAEGAADAPPPPLPPRERQGKRGSAKHPPFLVVVIVLPPSSKRKRVRREKSESPFFLFLEVPSRNCLCLNRKRNGGGNAEPEWTARDGGMEKWYKWEEEEGTRRGKKE